LAAVEHHQKPALYALIRLHAELGRRINDNKKGAAKLVNAMRHVESIIKMIEPTYDTRRIALKRRMNLNPVFKHGHVSRAVLELLRTATMPMSAEEISVALLQGRGIVEPSRDQTRLMYGAVSTALRTKLGACVAADGGRPRRWRLLSQ
jgi:hypothetical protein